MLSSPRAESARAVTGRQCPTSGQGEDFLTRRPGFFTKTAITQERKVEKSFPTWEMNRLSEGYKQAVDQNWGCLAKNWIFGPKTEILGPKKHSLLSSNHVLATTRKSSSKKKKPFSKINISLLRNFGDKTFFCQKKH